jgi:TamB, inner membrane protein subunit of TAM complex
MTKKRLGSLIAFALLVSILLGGGIYVRNFIRGQINKKIQSSFVYSRIHLHLFPPSVQLEDVRTVSPSPFFSASRVSITLPFRSLFKNDKPLRVFIDRPVIRILALPKKKPAKAGPKFSLALPFAIEKGLVRGGEFYYLGREQSFEARDFKASLSLKEDTLSLRLEAAASSLRIAPDRKPLEGELKLILESRGSRWRVNRFVLAGRDIWIAAQGSLVRQPDPRGNLRVSFRADMESLAQMLGLPFNWAGRIEGDGDLTRTQEEIKFTSSFGSRDLALNLVPLEKVTGSIEYSSLRGILVEMDMLKRSGPEWVRIRSAGGRVDGEIRAFHLDPVLAMGSLPWPVRSPAWGKFTMDGRQLVADFELRDTLSAGPPGTYPFAGPVRFVWDLKNEMQFSSPRLDTSFGRFSFQGKYILGGSVTLGIRGEVSDVAAARQFTSLVLQKELTFPDIRGSGIASVDIEGGPKDFRVGIEFALSPAGFDKYDVEAAEGKLEIQKETVRGQFRVDDPTLKGNIELFNSPTALDVKIKMAEGELARIVPALNLQLPLRGTGTGDFQVRMLGDSIRVEGGFSSPRILFGTQELKGVKGTLIWDGESITFPELTFDIWGGRVKSAWRLGTISGNVEIEAAGEGIDLNSFQPDLYGRVDFSIKGQGQLDQKDMAIGNFAIREVRVGPFPQVEGRGDLRLRLSRESLGLTARGSLAETENDFTIEAEIPFDSDSLAVDFKGGFSNLDLLFPWRGVKGRLDYEGKVRGVIASPQLNALLEIRGPVLPFPEFSQALTDYSGRIDVEGGRFLVRSFKGRLGGGEVEGSGEVSLGKGGEIGIDASIEGKSMVLSPLERTRALADASLRLIKDARRFVLEGDVAVQRLSWRRELLEKFVFSSRPYPQARTEPGFFDDLTLNVRLKADDNAWMENSLGRARGRFDLTVSGDVEDPIILGTIEALSGQAFFQDRKFQILRGRVSFFNPSSIEPYLDFRAETYVKDYRVTITISGLASRIRPQFSSSPPLPPEDVLALLAQGEAYKRQYRTETSSQLGTASLVSFTLMEGAQRSAEKLFSLDRFRIDPFLMGSSAEMTARLTIGKKISKDFYIYYSTNLTRQTEEIVRLDWDLSNEFSLVGTRNEVGRLSFDVKVRKRF